MNEVGVLDPEVVPASPDPFGGDPEKTRDVTPPVDPLKNTAPPQQKEKPTASKKAAKKSAAPAAAKKATKKAAKKTSKKAAKKTSKKAAKKASKKSAKKSSKKAAAKDRFNAAAELGSYEPAHSRDIQGQLLEVHENTYFGFTKDEIFVSAVVIVAASALVMAVVSLASLFK